MKFSVYACKIGAIKLNGPAVWLPNTSRLREFQPKVGEH